MKKYELTSNFVINSFGEKLFQIKATVDFGIVKKGELGGYIESEKNLTQNGNAWVSGNALVSGNAWVSDNARVSDNAWVYGNALVSDNARVSGNALVSGNADYATISGFGSEYRTTTFFRNRSGQIEVRCGCFYGTIEEFRAKVKQTHGETKKAIEYLKVADLMEYHFSKEEEEKKVEE